MDCREYIELTLVFQKMADFYDVLAFSTSPWYILFFANSQKMLTELFLIYISPGTSFFHNNGMVGEVMGLRPAGRSCFYEPLKEVQAKPLISVPHETSSIMSCFFVHAVVAGFNHKSSCPGCDQKHEEEMDSEAIYKIFVLQDSPFFKFNSSSKCLHSKLEMMTFNYTGDDSSDMDMDEKSRGGSFEVYSASGSSRGDIIALSSSEERDSVEKDVPNSQSLSGAAEGTSGGSDYEEKIISSSGRREIYKVKKNDDEENGVMIQKMTVNS
ncbi:hypothetical protein SO802_029109 [Lithocarpus litseifolius]|uniref:Uncharacterized protein n=1 Tax=Lithocarpus litseifolius TaxID=425828 RepID=A0AAW2BVD3_9ROSI